MVNITIYMNDIEIAEYNSKIIPRKSEIINLSLESENYKSKRYEVCEIEYFTEVYKDNSSAVNVMLYVSEI